jgi:hypothetical protein
MGAPGPRSVLIPVLALLLLAAAATDVVRRAILARPAASPAASQPSRAETVAIHSEASPSVPVPVAPTDRLDSAARAAALARIERDGAGTYLPAMLADNDSVLHRWADDRARGPVRVAVLGDDAVPGFRELFGANVAWAIGRWNGVGLPVWLEQSPDSSGADIVVSWADRLDSNRTGRTELTWQRRGPIVKVHVTLATHLPDGRQVQPTQMVALALHELGHAIGLGHSPVKSDALYPETSATDPTSRDRNTAILLYSLPPGSLR